MIRETIIGITEQFNQSTMGTIFWFILSITGAYKLIKEFVLDLADLVKIITKVGIRDILIIIALTLIQFILPLIVLNSNSGLNLHWVWHWVCWSLIISYISTLWVMLWLKNGMDKIDFPD